MEQDIFLGKDGARTLFSIEALSARSVQQFSALPAENEYLLLPGSVFRVNGDPADMGHGLHIVQLQQITPAHPAFE